MLGLHLGKAYSHKESFLMEIASFMGEWARNLPNWMRIPWIYSWCRSSFLFTAWWRKTSKNKLRNTSRILREWGTQIEDGSDSLHGSSVEQQEVPGLLISVKWSWTSCWGKDGAKPLWLGFLPNSTAMYIYISTHIYLHTHKSCLWKAWYRTMKIQEFYMKSLDQVCGSLLMKEKLSFTLLKDTILLLGQWKTLGRVTWWGKETKICALILLKLLLGFSFLHAKQKQTIWKNLCNNLEAFPMSNSTTGIGSLVPYQEVSH